MPHRVPITEAFPDLTNADQAHGASIFDATWRRMVAELVLGPLQVPHAAALQQAFCETPLQTPGQTAAATVGQLAEALKSLPRAANKAPVVLALARWWLDNWGDVLTPNWRCDPQELRESLRKIRGVGPETADRLLLFGANFPVFPVDRSALRIAVRHGWLSLPVDDEDAQSYFRSAAASDPKRMKQLSRWMHQLGEAHCGRTPNCSGCPLERFLPEGGPIDPERC